MENPKFDELKPAKMWPVGSMLRQASGGGPVDNPMVLVHSMISTKAAATYIIVVSGEPLSF